MTGKSGACSRCADQGPDGHARGASRPRRGCVFNHSPGVRGVASEPHRRPLGRRSLLHRTVGHPSQPCAEGPSRSMADVGSSTRSSTRVQSALLVSAARTRPASPRHSHAFLRSSPVSARLTLTGPRSRAAAGARLARDGAAWQWRTRPKAPASRISGYVPCQRPAAHPAMPTLLAVPCV
jgi:hypothetical protein